MPNAIGYNTSISASIFMLMKTFSKTRVGTMMKIAPRLDSMNYAYKSYLSKDENIP